ncbi:RluA family pseudouridine synthase [Paenibacillus sp. Marseille-Q4541]|uniref:RluA family pseudouridine synthase n=1 Tax=Paenibacillus sp. Marseille-Q4541 TaxID=2831522 RepID=UPI001BAAC67D|nr:RluA family pseudouridine synthase [Paenibacillus sp. Marseille-Q4541]
MITSKRRGEWLELTPGKKALSGENRNESAEAWLLNELGMPHKLLHELKHNQGIKIAGDRLRLALFPSVSLGITPRYIELDVLYEDDFCLVANKPAGMPVHPDGNERSDGIITLDHAVAAYYESQGQDVAVRHIHRLDVDTSGPVLYAKNRYAELKLNGMMEHKAIERDYVAIVHGVITQNEEVLQYPIGKDRHHKQRRRVSPTGQHAVTRMEVSERLDDATLVRLQLETGRTHQIRVHLSHIGHPLFGDTLYGGLREGIRRQALHGEMLTFAHPFTGDQLKVSSPWPEDIVELYEVRKNR